MDAGMVEMFHWNVSLAACARHVIARALEKLALCVEKLVRACEWDNVEALA